jgi:hypothetical protein
MSLSFTVQVLATGALLATSMPTLADHRWENRGHGRYSQPHVIEHRRPVREIVVERPVYIERQVVVERPVYVDRPIYVERTPVYDSGRAVYPADYPHGYPPASYPEPVHPRHNQPNMVGAATGAVVGAVIGSQIGGRHSRGATGAVGAVIGGMIGSQF